MLTNTAPASGRLAPLLFLSHSGIDTEAARALKARIEAAPDAKAAGLQVWFDKDDLTAGEPWQAQLEDAIQRRSTAFAVYLGSKGIVNWVEAEVRLGLSRATGDNAYRFISIIAGDSDGAASLPGFAAQYQGVRDVERRPEEFQKLVRAVLGLGVGGELRLEDEPFFGLRAIDETRSHLFFGRERETEDLVRLLRTEPLLMVTGDSGSGKSSLVKAALVPAWRGGALALLKGERPGDAVWHVVQMQPRGRPFAALGEAVDEAARLVGLPLADRGTLAGWAESGDPESVRRALRCDLPAASTRVLLIVDQLEELVTISREKDRTPFVHLLLALADPADERVRVALTMRRDFYNLLSVDPTKVLYDRLEANGRRARYLMGRMSDKGLRRVVTEPLRLAGVPEGDREALARSVLRDVGERPGDLALVQMALTETWDRRHNHAGDLLRSYAAVGGVEGAIAGAAEDVYVNLMDEAERGLAQPIFLRLVRLGDTAGATRRVAARGEFDASQWRLIQKLAGSEGKRLLMISGGEGSEAAELAHEALVSQWPRYQTWLQSVAPDKRIFDRLIERATGFPLDAASASTPMPLGWADRLATGADLSDFRGVAERHPDWLSETERLFTTASKEHWLAQIARDKRTNRRIRTFSIAISVLTVIIVLASVGIYIQNIRIRTQRDLANSQSAELLADQSTAALKSGNRQRAFRSMRSALAIAPLTPLSSHPSAPLEAATIRLTEFGVPILLPGIISHHYEISYPLKLVVALAPDDRTQLDVWSLSGAFRGKIGSGNIQLDGFSVASDRGTILTLSSTTQQLSEWNVADLTLRQNYSLGEETIRELDLFEYVPQFHGVLLKSQTGFHILDLEDGILRPIDGNDIPIGYREQFHPDRNRFAELHTKQEGSDITGRTSTILGWRNTAAANPRCPIVLTGGNDGVIREWDIKSQTLKGMIPFLHRVYNLTLSPMCDIFAASDEYGYTEVIDLATRRPLIAFEVSRPNNIVGFDYSGRSIAIHSQTETQIYSLGPSITPRSYSIEGIISAHMQGTTLLYHRELDDRHYIGIYDTLSGRVVHEVNIQPELGGENEPTILPLIYMKPLRGIVALVGSDIVLFRRQLGPDVSSEGHSKRLFALHQSYSSSLTGISPLVINDNTIFVRGTDSWGLLQFDLKESTFPVGLNVRWIPVDFENGDREELQYASAHLLNAGSEIYVINTSKDVYVWRTALKEKPVRLAGGHGCAYYTFSSASGAIFMQRYPSKNDAAADETECEPTIFSIDSNNGELHKLVNRYAVDASRWDQYVVYKSGPAIQVRAKDANSECKIPLVEDWSLAYIIPGDRRISNRSTQWLTGIEGFYSGALHQYANKARVLHNSHSRLLTIVYGKQMESYHLDGCQLVAVNQIHTTHPEAEIHDVELSPRGELLLATTGPENAGVIIRTRSGAEAGRIQLRAEVWNVVASDAGYGFLVEGYRPPHRVLDLGETLKSGLDGSFEAMRTALSDIMEIECADDSRCSVKNDSLNEAPFSSDGLIVARPSSLDAGNVAVCTDPLRHPLESYAGEHDFSKEIVVAPFFVAEFDSDVCFADDNSFFWEGRGHREFARARHLWSSGRRDEALAELRAASVAGNKLALRVYRYYESRGVDMDIKSLSGKFVVGSSEWLDSIAIFHFEGVDEYGGLRSKLKYGVVLGDPYSLGVVGEALISKGGFDSVADAYGRRALGECARLGDALGMSRARAYCDRIRRNLIMWSNPTDGGERLETAGSEYGAALADTVMQLSDNYIRESISRMGGRGR